MKMVACARCWEDNAGFGNLVESVTVVDGVTWTTLSCPIHGSVFVSADTGELDLGLVRVDPLGGNQFEFFTENFIDHVDSHPPRPSTTKVERGQPLWRWIVGALATVALIVGAILLIQVAIEDERRDDERSRILTSVTTPPTVPLATLPLPPITEAAEATTTAERIIPQIQVTEPPPPPFDPVAYVNGLAYCHACMPPAMEAYRVVATFYGWTQQQIDGRAAFVEIIMATESGGCWNVRRWGYGSIGQDCRELCKGGRRGECAHDDAGFGQITAILRPLTCEKAGICTTLETVASPWNSMLAYVVVLTELKSRPWCYLNNTHIRNGHCAKWPG